MFNGYYLGFSINGIHLIAGCNHNNYNIIDCYMMPIVESDDFYEITFTKVLVSVSNVYNNNAFIMIY
jgi:hypothetical protein